METPSLTQVAGLAIVLIIGRILYQVIYNLFISPLKKFPGPWLYAVTSIPYDLICIRGNQTRAVVALHEKYGPVIRVRPSELSYIDGRVWKDVYTVRPGHQEWVKGDTLHYMKPARGIIGAHRMEHRRFRRSLAHAFSKKGLREQEPLIRHYVNRAISGIAQSCEKGQTVNMVNWMSWTTTDVIGDLAFGEPFGCVDSAAGHHFMDSANKLVRPALIIGVLQRWGLSLLALLLIPREAVKGLKENAVYVEDKLKKRVTLGKDRGDFFDHVLKHGLLEKEEDRLKNEDLGFTFDELHGTASDIVLAGSETTATLLSGTIFYLLSHPDSHAKVTEVVRSAFSSDTDITIASTSPPVLPYLHAVLQETIRLYNPVPLFACRVAPPGGDSIAGDYVPAGTRASCSSHAAFRSEYNFARPREFLPERWLNQGNNDEFKNDNSSGVFQPFSFGPRNCIGMNLAQAESHLILAKLLWHFDLSRPKLGPEADKEWEKWQESQKGWFLWIKGPLMVDLKKRNMAES